MTPQQLMDLPGAGSAEKWLRNNGKWRLTPYENMCNAMGMLDAAIDDVRMYCDDAISIMETQ